MGLPFDSVFLIHNILVKYHNQVIMVLKNNTDVMMVLLMFDDDDDVHIHVSTIGCACGGPVMSMI